MEAARRPKFSGPRCSVVFVTHVPIQKLLFPHSGSCEADRPQPTEENVIQGILHCEGSIPRGLMLTSILHWLRCLRSVSCSSLSPSLRGVVLYIAEMIKI